MPCQPECRFRQRSFCLGLCERPDAHNWKASPPPREDVRGGEAAAARPEREGAHHGARPRAFPPNREGRHYGVITAKFVAVLETLLWGFHNAASGRCFPSYERIAERAHCARSTVYEAIHALERAGVLTWVNRIVRVREWGPDLFGRARNRWRVIRTSNAYTFVDPKTSSRQRDRWFRSICSDEYSSLRFSCDRCSARSRNLRRRTWWRNCGQHASARLPPAGAVLDVSHMP
jgi:hypothetical protein